MDVISKGNSMLRCEKFSLLFLVPANVLFALAAVTHTWFELPNVWYGLWWAKFCDGLGKCMIVPAFFTDEPLDYHLLQVICLFAWAGMFLSLYMIISTKMDHHIPKYLRFKRQTFIAILCLFSVFSMSGGLFYFYSMVNSFTSGPPEIHWSAAVAWLSCLLEFIAGLILLQG